MTILLSSLAAFAQDPAQPDHGDAGVISAAQPPPGYNVTPPGTTISPDAPPASGDTSTLSGPGPDVSEGPQVGPGSGCRQRAGRGGRAGRRHPTVSFPMIQPAQRLSMVEGHLRGRV
jgi:hypothetical protein